jgi:hypothetical protein
LPPKNSIRKIGKRVVSRGGGDAVALIANHSRGGPGHRPTARGPPPDGAIWLDANQVRERYGGRSAMWLTRILARDPSFPRAMKINRLRFFRLADLIAWERATAAKSAA